jgi:periplasmic protein TonB
MVLGSAAAHGLLVGIGVVTAASSLGSKKPDDGPVVIEVQERATPKPETPPPAVEPEARQPAPIAEPPRATAAKVRAQPQEPSTSAPLRVVGLSLESTSEGSDGPVFAVGATRLGETAERAEAPNQKAPEVLTPMTKVLGTNTNPTANRAATRIPTANVPFTMPKMRGKREPAYPATLKTQGIEADVVVAVSVNANGKATEVKLISPSPFPEFNEAARAAALSQDFDPATRDGVPIPYTLSYTYRFRIEEK